MGYMHIIVHNVTNARTIFYNVYSGDSCYGVYGAYGGGSGL